MKQLQLTSLFMLAMQIARLGQQIPETIVCNTTATMYEKLYLHIDREFYQPGDDVWFKPSLFSGINNRLIPGFKMSLFN